MLPIRHLHPAEVIRWVDADTVILRVHTDYRHIAEPMWHRLTWIQAPERFSDEGKLATARVNELAPAGSMIVIETFWLDGYPDSFGRWLGNVLVEQGSVSEILLMEGFAVPYTKK